MPPSSLEDQLKKLKQKNKQLQDKLDRTEYNISNFITDMDTLIESNDISTAIDMDIDSGGGSRIDDIQVNAAIGGRPSKKRRR